MAGQVKMSVWVDPSLLSAARASSGLGPGASPTELLRFSLATLAGMTDPWAVSRHRQPGRPRGNRR